MDNSPTATTYVYRRRETFNARNYQAACREIRKSIRQANYIYFPEAAATRQRLCAKDSLCAAQTYYIYFWIGCPRPLLLSVAAAYTWFTCAKRRHFDSPRSHLFTKPTNAEDGPRHILFIRLSYYIHLYFVPKPLSGAIRDPSANDDDEKCALWICFGEGINDFIRLHINLLWFRAYADVLLLVVYSIQSR